jgi:hypothetical protein
MQFISRIIVGVKYCFRYNARQRARAANGEEDAVDLQAMPRPHRRRREKKLMSLEEVNDRFPTIKYKSWRAQREAAGLPSEGGIKTASNSRASSIRELEVRTPSPPPASSNATSDNVESNSAVARQASGSTPTPEHPEDEKVPVENRRLSDISEGGRSSKEHDDDDDDDDNVQSAVSEELMKTVGDSCAICLDAIEDDDDVRGLTCGHAFHSACLDPWLTSRRACCPLCKKDYYIPKPRAEGEAPPAEEGRSRDRPRRGHRDVGGSSPTSVLLSSPFHRSLFFSRGVYSGPEERATRNQRPSRTSNASVPREPQRSRRNWSVRNPLHGLSIPRPAILHRNRGADSAAAPADVETGQPVGNPASRA